MSQPTFNFDFNAPSQPSSSSSPLMPIPISNFSFSIPVSETPAFPKPAPIFSDKVFNPNFHIETLIKTKIGDLKAWTVGGLEEVKTLVKAEVTESGRENRRLLDSLAIIVQQEPRELEGRAAHKVAAEIRQQIRLVNSRISKLSNEITFAFSSLERNINRKHKKMEQTLTRLAEQQHNYETKQAKMHRAMKKVLAARSIELDARSAAMEEQMKIYEETTGKIIKLIEKFNLIKPSESIAAVPLQMPTVIELAKPATITKSIATQTATDSSADIATQINSSSQVNTTTQVTRSTYSNAATQINTAAYVNLTAQTDSSTQTVPDTRVTVKKLFAKLEKEGVVMESIFCPVAYKKEGHGSGSSEEVKGIANAGRGSTGGGFCSIM